MNNRDDQVVKDASIDKDNCLTNRQAVVFYELPGVMSLLYG
jgi:hypothetical protein